MKLFIKNMISLPSRTKAIAVIEALGLHPVAIDIGEVEIQENFSSEEYHSLKTALLREDMELINDKEVILAEKVEALVIEMIHYSEELPEIKYSDYISNKLHLSYTYLSRCFSKLKNTTLAHFIIFQKIERAKELLLYNDMTLSEIAWKLRYSSSSHLSAQFKKITGLTPSRFKSLMSFGNLQQS